MTPIDQIWNAVSTMRIGCLAALAFLALARALQALGRAQ